VRLRRNAVTRLALQRCDLVVTVARADPVGLHAFIRGYQELRELGVPQARVRVAVNQIRAGMFGGDRPAEQVGGALARYVGIRPTAFVPYDRAGVDAALLAGQALREARPGCPAQQALAGLASALVAPRHPDPPRPAPRPRGTRRRRPGRRRHRHPMTTTAQQTADQIVEREVRELVRQRGLDPGNGDADAVRRLIDEVVADYAERRLVASMPPLADPGLVAKTVAYRVIGMGPLQLFFDDPDIEEIWINEPGKVFVAKTGRPQLTTTVLTEQQVGDLVERMPRASGRRVDLSSPFVDATLADGSRLPSSSRTYLQVLAGGSRTSTNKDVARSPALLRTAISAGGQHQEIRAPRPLARRARPAGHDDRPVRPLPGGGGRRRAERRHRGPHPGRQDHPGQPKRTA